jgi:rhamnulokinase
MSQSARFLAVDLGASSGRAMVCSWSGECFGLEEVHRFPNCGVPVGGDLFWDALGLWQHLLDSLTKYRADFGDVPAGIAIDAWGVDFALLDANGRLLGNPRHYRDLRTDGIVQHLFEMVPEEEWFAETGVQTMEINTLFQLYSTVKSRDPQLALADKLIMVPDLFLYFLSGEKCVEYTEATTSQMYSLRRSAWAASLLERVGIGTFLLPPVLPPAKIVGPVRSRVLEECGFTGEVPAIAAASHDTACAVASIPEMDDHSVFLSCGTWSLIGVEATAPNTSAEAHKLRFTNEGSASGGISAAQKSNRTVDSAGMPAALEDPWSRAVVGRLGERSPRGARSPMLLRSKRSATAGAQRHAGCDPPVLPPDPAGHSGIHRRNCAVRIREPRAQVPVVRGVACGSHPPRVEDAARRRRRWPEQPALPAHC